VAWYTQPIDHILVSVMSESKQDNLQPDSSGWSASLYNKTAAFVYSPAFTAPVLGLLAAQPGERILDVGCGSGEVTLVLQEIVEKAERGVVVGTDNSESMVSAQCSLTSCKANRTSAREGESQRCEACISRRCPGASSPRRYHQDLRHVRCCV